MKKDRICRGCGKCSVAHDRRNCLALVKSYVVHVSANYESGLENNFEAFIEGEASERSTSEDETLTQI